MIQSACPRSHESVHFTVRILLHEKIEKCQALTSYKPDASNDNVVWRLVGSSQGGKLVRHIQECEVDELEHQGLMTWLTAAQSAEKVLRRKVRQALEEHGSDAASLSSFELRTLHFLTRATRTFSRGNPGSMIFYPDSKLVRIQSRVEDLPPEVGEHDPDDDVHGNETLGQPEPGRRRFGLARKKDKRTCVDVLHAWCSANPVH